MQRTKTGQFLPTPKGQKTRKMLEVEQELGRTLEEDFREYHIEKRWGQKRIADRWGVPRGLIFSNNLRSRRRCWATMLNLPVRRLEQQADLQSRASDRKLTCEVCGRLENLEAAHWIRHAEGGGRQSFNILRLCPNCHRKLDRDDPITTERAKEILLFREAKRIIEKGQGSNAKLKELVRVCEAIITRKIT